MSNAGRPVWTGEIKFVPSMLDQPFRWKSPQRIFVNSMSDLFHEDLPFDDITAVFGIMAACKHHVFQVLTKRPKRMLEWFDFLQKDVKGRFIIPAIVHHAACIVDSDPLFRTANELAGKRHWPLPNVWLGVSVEDQKTADERIPLLLQTPAEIRWISAEPLLGPIDLSGNREFELLCKRAVMRGETRPPHLDWVVVGGESGPEARPFDVRWARSIINQCKSARVPCFVKQLGSNPVNNDANRIYIPLKDYKGGDMNEWPENLRIREYPDV